jgi:hypothetical protein
MIGLFAMMAAGATAPQAQIADESAPIIRGADTCVPMRFVDGLPIIPATLAGQSLSLGFDTGAPHAPDVDPLILQRLHFKQIGEAEATDPSLRNAISLAIYDLRDLKIGNFRIERWQAIAHPPKSSRFANPDGIIGLDAFAGYIVTIDYPGRRFILKKGRLPPADGRSSFHYDGSIPAVPLTIDGHTTEAHIDTGNARYPVIVPETFAAQLPGYTQRFPIGTAHTVNNKYDLVALPIHDSKIGDFPLYAGTVASPGPSRGGNIGSQILKDMIIRIDPANSIISFERAKADLEDGCPTH